MPLQPSRRDTIGPPPLDVSDLAAIVRHQGSYLRSLDPGILGGTRATPQPLRHGNSPLVGGDEGGGDGEDNAVVGEDGDRYTVTSLTNPPPWSLSYIPIAETVHVRFHPDGDAGVPWLRDEQFTIDDDSNVVVITAAVLAANKAEVGDVLSAQYLRDEGEQDAPTDSRVEDLTVRGFTSQFSTSGANVLPTGTQIGDLIVAVCATAVTVGAGHGRAYIDDPRLVQVGHAMWAGIATSLDPVNYVNPFGDRMTGAMASFVEGVFPGASATSGPGGGGTNSVAAPTPVGSAAIMGFAEENPNGLSGTLDSWPAGYTKVTLNSGGVVCKAYILYWQPDGTDVAPSGTVGYTASSSSSTGWADVLGLQGEEE